MHEKCTDVIIRTFKTGAGPRKKPPPDEHIRYRDQIAEAIKRIKDSVFVRHVYVVVNGDPDSPLAEIPYADGSTYTTRLIRQLFPHSNVRTLVCTEWGMNPGSDSALNQAIYTIKNSGDHPRWVLMLSKEIQMNELILHEAILLNDRHDLVVCGFFRQNWWERYQWQMVQNTAALWDFKTLIKFDGFDHRCNGTGETIEVDGINVPLAGMEDFHLLLRIQAVRGRSYRWGMVMKTEPLTWDLSRKNLAEMTLHNIKVARQAAVMHRWADEIMPKSDWSTIMNLCFSRQVSL
ncbi:hypothetical protein KKF61_00450 [Patescibacteria group bacterium]|nr:hypothetical protein [Patescibacteria group bacterium]MBU0963603.1 hypothetical protein [Patescibacteria group bacterium]